MAALFGKEQAVLEIGPGFGALTAALAETCGRVTAVEKDKLLMPLLYENLKGYSNISLIEGDALRLDLTPLDAGAVCANLPYSLTTPILTRLIESNRFDPVIVMIQKEVAQRLTAKPASPEYGALTVFAALHTVCTVLFDVSPGCFMPRPAVTSSVVRFDRKEPHPLTPLALRISKAAFAQRRKTLLNALSAGLALPREVVTDMLLASGIGPSIRGETLSFEQFLDLAGSFEALAAESGKRAD
jgi:16S rRNA (adenine1518-N6/adenine1519-N6)-dimethyltransferase